MGEALQVFTKKTAAPSVGVIRHVDTSPMPFDPVCFDIIELQRKGLVDGFASAGRGNTVFFTLHDETLVLRHYHRGGLVRHISTSHYVFSGYQKTRALREFDLLIRLQEIGLPAPRAYACRVLRKGLLYTASLITYRLPGRTLAQAMQSQAMHGYDGNSGELCLTDSAWRALGEVIGQFHAAGIYHADLNAHNIMIDDNQRVSLIDFDRGAQRPLPENPVEAGWCLDNMNRLERSITKIAAARLTDPLIIVAIERKYHTCKVGWAERVKR